MLSKQDFVASVFPAASDGCGAMLGLLSRFPEQHLALWTLITD